MRSLKCGPKQKLNFLKKVFVVRADPKIFVSRYTFSPFLTVFLLIHSFHPFLHPSWAVIDYGIGLLFPIRVRLLLSDVPLC